MAFHLNRETGKIIRIVSQGSQKFVQVLRMSMFNLAPLVMETTFVLIIYLSLFPWTFCVLQFCAIALYMTVTYLLTNVRKPLFAAQAKSDHKYNQIATDSLLNFETVKYFNAEDHEEHRFNTSLQFYKLRSIILAKSLVMMNIS